MTIAITATKNTLADAYASALPYGVLFDDTPATDGSATNELDDDSYDREALTWGSGSGGVITSAATDFGVDAGTTVKYFGVAASATKTTADIGDTVAVTNQVFASDGTYTVTATYTQT